MDKYNVHQKKDLGRTTQYMSENFSDLAKAANEKLLDQNISKERRKEVLKEVHGCLLDAQKKADQVPQSPKLQKIMAQLQSVTEKLEDHIANF